MCGGETELKFRGNPQFGGKFDAHPLVRAPSAPPLPQQHHPDLQLQPYTGIGRSMSRSQRKMAPHNYYWLQQLAVLSLMATPVQALQFPRAAPLRLALAFRGLPWHSYGCDYYLDGREIRTPRQTRTGNKCRQDFSRLFSAGDDFDAFIDGLDIEKSVIEGPTLPHFVRGKEAIGIGGNSGFTYDVNALKRNLVQESVRGCKQELLVLLGDGRQYGDSITKDGKRQPVLTTPRWRRDRDDLIEERLSALVQVCSINFDIFPPFAYHPCSHS